MRLLFDQNLRHRLPDRLGDLFPGSLHVRHQRLDRAADEEVWSFAKREGLCIVTQDCDFADRSRLHGAPPKVAWLRCGNSTPAQMEAILRRDAELLLAVGDDPALHLAILL